VYIPINQINVKKFALNPILNHTYANPILVFFLAFNNKCDAG